jgi:outer membrane PBP1 activator LpoA protein
MPVASVPGVIQDQADPNAVLAQLSLELRKYVVRSRSVPKNYEEFIAKSQVQAPPPPAGKKYAIQNKAVVLVNR